MGHCETGDWREGGREARNCPWHWEDGCVPSLSLPLSPPPVSIPFEPKAIETQGQRPMKQSGWGRAGGRRRDRVWLRSYLHGVRFRFRPSEEGEEEPRQEEARGRRKTAQEKEEWWWEALFSPSCLPWPSQRPDTEKQHSPYKSCKLLVTKCFFRKNARCTNVSLCDSSLANSAPV